MADEAPAKKTAAKKSTKKRTARKSTASKGKSFGEQKRDDAKERVKKARKEGGGLDRNDPLLGWDAQQGRVRPVDG